MLVQNEVAILLAKKQLKRIQIHLMNLYQLYSWFNRKIELRDP